MNLLVRLLVIMYLEDKLGIISGFMKGMVVDFALAQRCSETWVKLSREMAERV